MDFSWLLSGFVSAMQPINFLVALVGCFLGTLVGVLPGLGPTSAVALLFPFTAIFSPEAALIGLGAIYYGAMYGGSTTSVLLNIPGEVASVPAAIEGYPLTKEGRGGPVLVICALVSFMGGTMALVGLAFFAPKLADLALAFGPFEYLSLMLLSLACAAGLSGASVVRGMGAAFLGLFVSIVGFDPSSSLYRLTFGFSFMLEGFDVVPVVVGLFGIGEVLFGVESDIKAIVSGAVKNLMPSRRELSLGLRGGLRGSILGSVLGILPGITASVSSFLSYALEKRVATERHRYGKGMMEGVAGPEAANNAASVASFIPLMALGIPTGPVLAIVLAALIIQGVIPGPLMFTVYKDLAATVIASFFIGNIILVILNIPLVGIWVRISMIPYKILAPVILFLCVLGSYCIRNSIFDLWVMLLFGFLGFFAKKTSFPVPPFVLGLILGPQLELYFHQAASVGFSGIFQRPVAIVAAILAIILLGVFSMLTAKNKELAEE